VAVNDDLHDRRVVEIVYTLLTSPFLAALPVVLIFAWMEADPGGPGAGFMGRARDLSLVLAAVLGLCALLRLVAFERRIRRG